MLNKTIPNLCYLKLAALPAPSDQSSEFTRSLRGLLEMIEPELKYDSNCSILSRNWGIRCRFSRIYFGDSYGAIPRVRNEFDNWWGEYYSSFVPKEAYSFVPIRLYSDDIPFVNVQVYATLSSDYWFAETPKVIEKLVLPSWSETLCTAFMEALQSVNGPNWNF